MTAKKELHLAHAELLEGTKVLYCGYHDCPGGYAYGPVVRDEYIVHFVREGCGRYQINRLLFPIRAGSSFTLFPGVLLHYQADKVDPWRYYWLAFGGPNAGRLLERIGVTPASPVVEHRKPVTVLRLFEQALRAVSARSVAGDLAATSAFYRLLSAVASDAAPAGRRSARRAQAMLDDRVLRAVSLMQENFRHAEFTVEQVAGMVCLERSYFSKLFKLHMGISPRRFLGRTRLESACRMLEEFSVPIKQVATSCGYRDQSYFDKAFRSGTGISPSRYRETLARKLERGQPPPEPELTRNLFS